MKKTWFGQLIAIGVAVTLIWHWRAGDKPPLLDIPRSASNENPSPSAAEAGVRAPASGEWQALFNGHDLAGWRHVGGGRSFVRDGVLCLANDGERRTGYLVSTVQARNFRAKLRCQVPTGDSGFYFRARVDPHTPAEVLGPQVQLNFQPDSGLGGLFEPQGRGWLVKPSPDLNARLVERALWIDCDIEVVDRRVRVKVDGVTTVDFTDADPDNRYLEAGFFALQIHGGGHCDARFASITLQLLD
jgi:hypothetical protein